MGEGCCPDTTLDGQLMEGTTYLEHSALGVSLDSGLMAGDVKSGTVGAVGSQYVIGRTTW